MAASQRFVVRVGDREHEVSIEPGDVPGTSRVLVDGVEREVVDAPAGAYLVRDPETGRQLGVTLDSNGRPTGATVNGLATELTVLSAEEAALAEALSADHSDTGGVVASPMPGRVVKVLVAEGEEVERGAPVVIIEAMKMENELHAPTAGVVARVAAKPDDTVDAGQVVCEITPHE